MSPITSFETTYEKRLNWFTNIVFKIKKCIIILRSKQFILINIEYKEPQIRMGLSRSCISEIDAIEILETNMNALIEANRHAQAVKDLLNPQN